MEIHNEKEFIELTCAGLRKMTIKPDSIAIVISELPFDVSLNKVSDVTAFLCDVPYSTGYSGLTYPAIPLFISISEKDCNRQTYLFQRGMYEGI